MIISGILREGGINNLDNFVVTKTVIQWLTAISCLQSGLLCIINLTIFLLDDDNINPHNDLCIIGACNLWLFNFR